MTFTTCGVIVGSRILVVTQRACHAVGSCVNCENTTRCEYHWPCSNPYNNRTRHYTTVGHSYKSVHRTNPIIYWYHSHDRTRCNHKNVIMIVNCVAYFSIIKI